VRQLACLPPSQLQQVRLREGVGAVKWLPRLLVLAPSIQPIYLTYVSGLHAPLINGSVEPLKSGRSGLAFAGCDTRRETVGVECK
jgi:hypothetical protein